MSTDLLFDPEFLRIHNRPFDIIQAKLELHDLKLSKTI